MNGSRQLHWSRAVLLLGVVYFFIGLTFGTLAGSASSSQMRGAWRLLAWLMSAIAFVGHIWYEHSRLRSSRVTTAFHAALAVALGAFLVAVTAVVNGQMSGASHQSRRIMALVLWPILAGLPAFAVALASAAALSLRRRRT